MCGHSHCIWIIESDNDQICPKFNTWHTFSANRFVKKQHLFLWEMNVWMNFNWMQICFVGIPHYRNSLYSFVDYMTWYGHDAMVVCFEYDVSNVVYYSSAATALTFTVGNTWRILAMLFGAKGIHNCNRKFFDFLLLKGCFNQNYGWYSFLHLTARA